MSYRKYMIFRVFKCFILITNNIIYFFRLNLFRISRKTFGIILSFFSYLLRQTKLISSKKLFPFNMKKNKFNTKLFKKCWIVFLYFINICYDIFISYEFLNFFWNMHNPKLLKYVTLSLFIHIQSYSVGSYWFILTKIYYICAILSFR